MKPKLTHALAGLALAMVLALVAVSPSGSSETKPDALDVVPATAENRTEATTRFDDAVIIPTTTTTVAPEILHQLKHMPVDTEAATPVEESAPAPAAETAAEPTPEPATAPAGSIEEIINRYFGAAAPRAFQIARCESNMNPGAVSRTNDHGLFQINIVHQGNFQAVTGQPWSAVYNPEYNTMYAKHLYDSSGWGPWVCNRKV